MRRLPFLGSALLGAVVACADPTGSTNSGSTSPVTNAEGTAPTPTPTGAAQVPILARTIYALDNQNTLVVFDGDRPGQVTRRVPIVTPAPAILIGIDFRPNDSNLADGDQTGLLYAVSSTGNIYTVELTTGVATLRSTITPSLGQDGGLEVGTGIGFNPMADRLRLHDLFGRNLRVNVETGATITDTPLAYAAGDANAGLPAVVVATAYTNNVSPAPATTELFAIDSRQSTLVKLASPNNGQLSTVAKVVVSSGLIGFDIPGRATDRLGYVTFTPPRFSQSFLYRINIDDGSRQPVGPVDHPRPILSIAVDDRPNAPSPIGASLVQDPQGDFLSTYAGPRNGDVDVLTAEVTYNGTSFVFTSTHAAPVGTTAGATYVWGINRGTGTARFAALGLTGVLFDAVVTGRPDGTATATDLATGVATNLPAGASVVSGNQLRITVPASLFPSRGFAAEQYTANLWPRVGSGNNNQISDFAPDNGNAPVRTIAP